MSYKSASILDFKEYVFNDTGSTARHFGLVIIPEHLTEFKHSVYCAVITSKMPRIMWSVQALDSDSYPCFSKVSYIRMRDLDYVPLRGLDSTKKQPVGSLTNTDCKKAFKLLKGVMFSSSTPIDKYLRGAILREWKKALSVS